MHKLEREKKFKNEKILIKIFSTRKEKFFFARTQIFYFFSFFNTTDAQNIFFFSALLFIKTSSRSERKRDNFPYLFLRTWYSFETRRSTEATNEQKNRSAINWNTHRENKKKVFLFSARSPLVHPKDTHLYECVCKRWRGGKRRAREKK